MTLDQALACLRELRALERLQRAVHAMETRSPDWTYALNAYDDRLRLVQYCLSETDPSVVAVAQYYYDQELLGDSLAEIRHDEHSDGRLSPEVPDTLTDTSLSDVAVSRLIH